MVKAPGTILVVLRLFIIIRIIMFPYYIFIQNKLYGPIVRSFIILICVMLLKISHILKMKQTRLPGLMMDLVQTIDLID